MRIGSRDSTGVLQSDPELLRGIGQVAAFLGINARQVSLLAKERGLPLLAGVGHHKMSTKTAILRWLEREMEAKRGTAD